MSTLPSTSHTHPCELVVTEIQPALLFPSSLSFSIAKIQPTFFFLSGVGS